MTNQSSIDILNGVLETLIDSADGYNSAAEVTDRDTFKQFFIKRAAARRAMAAAVRSEIESLGGTAEDDGTILAGAHRMFMKLSAVVQNNDEAAIEAVDDGEEHLREKIADAIKDDDLSPAAKAAIAKFQGELQADCRMIEHIEDAA